MNSPSLSRLPKGIKSLSELTGEYSKAVILQKAERTKMDGEFVMSFKERAWKHAPGAIKTSKQDQSIVRELLEKERFVFGCVMAVFVLKHKPVKTVQPKNPARLGSIIDWALIKPVNRSVGSNDASSATRPGLTSLFGLSDGERQSDLRLAKIGYVTDFTQGRYSGLRSVTISTKMVNGRQVEVRTMEHVMTSGPFDTPIVKEGDSGSLVFGITGFVVGMCFGGTHTGDLLYFTHIVDLIEDNKAVTGVSQIRLRE